MIKGVGLILIGAACAAWGFSMADRLKKRRDFLEAFITSLSVLETEIAFGRHELRTIFKGMDNERLMGFYALCADRIRSTGAREAWETAARLTSGAAWLDENDVAAISSLGAELGRTDIEGQRKNIGRARELLMLRADNARREYDRLARVYRGCGILAGAFIVIVLI